MFKFKSEIAGSAVAVSCAVAVTVLCALYGFAGMFDRAYVIFMYAREEDMLFGFLVPLISIAMLVKSRREIADSVLGSRFSFLGFAATFPFLALALLGSRGVQLRLEQLGFIGLCFTIPWTFWGWRCAKQFLVPAAYLLFCVPLATFLDFVTIQLRYIVTNASVMLLNGIGLAAVRDGTAIVSSGPHCFAVDIVDRCTGLNSLFALAALVAGYAYFTQPTWLRRLVLFSFSVPLAVVGNIARIFTICIVAVASNTQLAAGGYHDYANFVVFIVAVGLMVYIRSKIDDFSDRRKGCSGVKAACGAKKELAWADFASAWRPGVPHAVCAVCAAMFFAGVFVFQAKTPPATVSKAPEVGFAELAGYSTDDGKFAEQQKVSEGERKILPGDTRIYKKMYESRSGAQFLASFVVGGVSRASIHRPELCLPSQGYAMSNPRNFDVEGRPWHVIDIAKPGVRPAMEAYTFFNQEGFRTASHTHRIWRDVIDRSVLNRVDRWVMLTVNASGATEGELLEFLKAMGAFK